MAIARSAAVFGGVVPVSAIPFPVILHPTPFPIEPIAPVPVSPAPPVSLPVANTQNGCIFSDRNDANLYWYLPDIELTPDVDPSFAFVASQTEQQQDGHPYNQAQVTLSITRSTPSQVTTFTQANPAAKMVEIPLENLSPVLSTTYIDQNGHTQVSSFTGTVNDVGDGTLVLTFAGILGDSVLLLYQDLRVFGKAALTLSASYQAWFQPPTPRPFPPRPWPPRPLPPRPWPGPVPVHPVQMAADANAEAVGAIPVGIAPMPFRPPVEPPIFHPPIDPLPPRPMVQTTESYAQTLPLALKYNADGYQLRYTVSTLTIPSHVILSAADLSTFNQPQTQFAELKALGDINLKYPSINRAYVGQMSKTIVLIPQRYSILRGAGGCEAQCTARLDTSPSSTSGCLFDFSFTVAPEVNRVELAKLLQDVAADSDLQGYTVTFADFLKDSPPSTLLTSFASVVQFADGADPHTFALTVTIADAGANAPAVTDANLFILRLSAQTGTDLIGQLSLKLDDGYPDPVTAILDLNLQHTTGAADELLAQFDEGAEVIVISNPTALDLQLQEYALVENGTLSDFPGTIALPAGGKAQVPLPAKHEGLAFLSVAQLLLPVPLDAATVAKLLNFETENVEDTQVVVAVDASQVDFKKVASLAIEVVFPSLTSVTPWTTTLTRDLLADSTHVQIPIEDAVFSLPGTVTITVSWTDATRTPVIFTLENDFASTPVVSVAESQIEHAPTSEEIMRG